MWSHAHAVASRSGIPLHAFKLPMCCIRTCTHERRELQQDGVPGQRVQQVLHRAIRRQEVRAQARQSICAAHQTSVFECHSCRACSVH
jgi:hypothetical protein